MRVFLIRHICSMVLLVYDVDIIIPPQQIGVLLRKAAIYEICRPVYVCHRKFADAFAMPTAWHFVSQSIKCACVGVVTVAN